MIVPRCKYLQSSMSPTFTFRNIKIVFCVMVKYYHKFRQYLKDPQIGVICLGKSQEM